MPYLTAMAHCPTGHDYVIDILILPSWRLPAPYPADNRYIERELPTGISVEATGEALYALLDTVLADAGYDKLRGWVRPDYVPPLGAKHAHVRRTPGTHRRPQVAAEGRTSRSR